MCSRLVTEVSNNLDEIIFISKGAQRPACADASTLLTAKRAEQTEQVMTDEEKVDYLVGGLASLNLEGMNLGAGAG